MGSEGEGQSDSAEQYNNPCYQRTVEIETRFDYGCTASQRYEAETDFALRCAGVDLGEGDRVLDLACGVGAHADLIREKTGCSVDAFDKEPNPIEAARLREVVRQKQGDVRQAISFQVGDMADISREIEGGRRYKLITILGDSFIYLPNEDAIKNAFRQYIDLLEPGGRLVLQFRGRGANYQERSAEKDEMRAKAGVVQRNDYIAKATYGDVLAGELVRYGLMEDAVQRDGVFYYMSEPKEHPSLPEGVKHYAFGRVYVDQEGVEHNLGTAEITDFRSSDKGRDILKRLLMEVGFADIAINRASLGGGRDLVALSAGKSEVTDVSGL
jgi:SAM-dependent methyltransferase